MSDQQNNQALNGAGNVSNHLLQHNYDNQMIEEEEVKEQEYIPNPEPLQSGHGQGNQQQSEQENNAQQVQENIEQPVPQVTKQEIKSVLDSFFDEKISQITLQMSQLNQQRENLSIENHQERKLSIIQQWSQLSQDMSDCLQHVEETDGQWISRMLDFLSNNE